MGQRFNHTSRRKVTQPLHSVTLMKIDAFFSKIAELSSIADRYTVYFRAKEDKFVTWQFAVSHPLEVLENVYSHKVRQALKKDDDLLVRMQTTQDKLSEYFELGEIPARLMGKERPTDPELKVLDAVRIVNKISDGREEDKENNRDSFPSNFTLQTLETIERLFKDNNNVAALSEARKILIDVLFENPQRAGAGSVAEWLNKDIKSYDAYLEKLAEIAADFKKNLKHFTIIKINNSIDAFVLLRYYVSYEVRGSQLLLTQNEIRSVSVGLTDLLHNTKDIGHHELLSCCLSEIEEKLLSAPGLNKHVLFYLKGGRALQFFLETPEKGDNDWDCQFLIDPDLPAAEWYEKYRLAQNVLLEAMFSVRRKVEAFFLEKADESSGVLFSLTEKMDERKDAIREKIQGVLDQANLEIDEDPYLGDYREYQNTKAELIDVGAARRDTVELWEQWHLLHGQLLEGKYGKSPGPSIPPAIYYLNEHLLMVSEVIGKRSKAAAKLVSRITRLKQILERYDLPQDDHYSTRMGLQTDNSDVQKIARVRFNQIWESFGCDVDPELGARVKSDFVDAMNQQTDKLVFQNSTIWDSLGADAQGAIKLAANKTWTPDIDRFFCCLWRLQDLSRKLIDTQKDRSTKLVTQVGIKNKVSPLELVESMFEKLDGLINSPREERYISLVYTGGHAANCHYNFLKGRNASLEKYKPEPVPYLSAALHCVKYKLRDDSAIPTESQIFEFVESLIEPCKAEFKHADHSLVLKSNRTNFTFELYVDEGLAGVIKLEFHAALSTVPFVSYVWGKPCLSLKDLVREYTRRLAITSDFAVQGSLREALDQVTGIMTEFTTQ
jgi:hypothetical protein